jgi:hypothetical protein
MRMRVRSGAAVSLVPVASAMALLAFCVAGARLYGSSAGSAAFASQIDETCRSDSAMSLPLPLGAAHQDDVDAIAAGLVNVDAPRRGNVTEIRVPVASGPDRRVTLIHLDDVESDLTLRPLGRNEIALSRTNLSELALAVGDTLPTTSGAPLTVTQSFDDVPNAPVPDFWCGWPELFELTAGGDPPPPSAIASPDTISAFGAFTFDEYRVTHEPLTIAEARDTVASFDAAEDAWNARFAAQFGRLRPNEMQRVVQRAVAVTDTVERSLAPVLLTAIVAVSVVLGAAAVLLARARRRELRLFAVRGLPPWRIATGVAGGLSIALAVGAAIGAGLAHVAVRAAGPSSLLEPAAVSRGAITVAGAVVAAVPTVAAVVGIVADRYVDRSARRFGVTAAVAIVLVGLVALTVVAFRRLDRDGGIRTFGVESRGGSLLSLGFPLFAVLAMVAVAAAAVVVAVRPLRMSGRRLHRSLRLGWRRVVLEAAPLGAIVAAVALAAGCLTTANALADAAKRQLDEKAAVYVGADLAVTVFDDPAIPADWAGATSLAATCRGRADGRSFELLGIDPARFAEVAALRADASDRSLRELVAAIDVSPTARPAPAIAVGTDAAVGDLVSIEPPGSADILQLEVVEVIPFFPFKSSGAAMFVVDRDVVGNAVPFPVDVLFVRDPPDGAVADLQARGVRTGVVRDARAAFDGSAYSALRWAYAPLAVLGLLFAVVALALQLLVVAARATARRATHAIMRRTGFGTRDLLAASFVETGIPLAIGTALGVSASALAGSLAVGRLDPMPSLQPPTLFETPWATVIAVALAVPVWAVAIAALITWTTVRSDPMEVLHGEL